MPRPGTELNMLLQSLRLRPKKDCECREVMEWMDHIGVEGCKRDRDLLIARINQNAMEYGVWDQLTAGINWMARPFPVNPLDPVPGLFAEAIRRAESET